MADITFEIVEELGVLSTSAKGWTKELNLVSWNWQTAKIRHPRMESGNTKRWAKG